MLSKLTLCVTLSKREQCIICSCRVFNTINLRLWKCVRCSWKAAKVKIINTISYVSLVKCWARITWVSIWGVIHVARPLVYNALLLIHPSIRHRITWTFTGRRFHCEPGILSWWHLFVIGIRFIEVFGVYEVCFPGILFHLPHFSLDSLVPSSLFKCVRQRLAPHNW